MGIRPSASQIAHVELVRTPRLTLEPLSPDHREPLYAIYSEPAVQQHLISRPRDQADFNDLFARMLEMAAFLGMWAILHQPSGKLIGRCGFYSFSEAHTPELAFLLSGPFWGAGLATEASRACLDHAFSTRAWSEVVALVRPANPAAIRVLTKVGMHPERTLELNGSPAVLYRILRSQHGSRSGLTMQRKGTQVP